MRRLAGTLIAAVLLIVGPTGHAAPSVQSALGTRFVAERTSVVRVDFGRGIATRDLDARIVGRGRVYGFYLRKVGEFAQEGNRPFVENIGIGQCAERGCKGRRTFRTTFFYATGERLEGLWDLYVIADGAPVSVSFGATKRTMRPVARVKDEIVTLDPHKWVEDGERVVSAGARTELGEVDFGLLGLWTRGESGHNTAFGGCFYADDSLTKPPAQAAFLPGCPTGEGTRWVNEADQRPSGFVYAASYHGNYQDIGGWYATSASVERMGAIAYWLNF